MQKVHFYIKNDTLNALKYLISNSVSLPFLGSFHYFLYSTSPLSIIKFF